MEELLTRDGPAMPLNIDPALSWNEVAIQLNNRAMDDLHDNGDLLSAYLNLSGALTAIGRAIPVNHRNSPHDPAVAAAYAYSWVKCSNETFLNRLSPQANPGYLSYMCLRFLRIDYKPASSPTSKDILEDYKAHCPCHFSWSIYYNVGILCTVLGTVLSRQTQYTEVSDFMLEQGRSFMDSVLIRVEAEKPNNRDWATVHISVMLNRALADLEGRISQQPTSSTSTSTSTRSSSPSSSSSSSSPSLNQQESRPVVTRSMSQSQGHSHSTSSVSSMSSTLSSSPPLADIEEINIDAAIAADDHLKRTRECLTAYSKFFEFEDLMEFYFSLQPFLSSPCAQAA